MSKVNYKEVIAERASRELVGPCIVNLGIGVPTLIPEFVTDDTVYLHTENGLLGVGYADENNIDPNLVNAGKQPVSELKGSSYFNSAESFGMIRGGHIDVAVLGVLQVDEKGRIANWSVPGKDIIGVGGAMDLLSGAKRVICTMTHTTFDKQPKILKECTYPITSTKPVDMIITELAVFKVKNEKLYLVELMPNATLSDVEKNTEANFIVELQGGETL